MRGGQASISNAGSDLFNRIGAFLRAHALSPEPSHYLFAHTVLSEPDGLLARAVWQITDDGVRLSGRDIERLGGQIVANGNDANNRAQPSEDDQETALLFAETRAHMHGVTRIMKRMHAETHVFGRDLEEMTGRPEISGIDEIARLTGAMLARVRDAEQRLADATTEADALRSKLAAATDDARTDVLTGLPNRRAFEEMVAGRNPADAPFCLAVCDVDRFKHINDEHGHIVGDRVLSAIARSLAETCGDHLVTRYGGEEFAIFLTKTDLHAAQALMDQVRRSVAGKRFRVRETDNPLGQITISIGVTTLPASEDAVIAYDRADRLLYSAKAAGRDQVKAA